MKLGVEGSSDGQVCVAARDGNASDILPDLDSLSEVNESIIEDCLASLKDNVTSLASTDPLFKPELERYLEAESAQVKAKVESWLQSVQPE